MFLPPLQGYVPGIILYLVLSCNILLLKHSVSVSGAPTEVASCIYHQIPENMCQQTKVESNACAVAATLISKICNIERLAEVVSTRNLSIPEWNNFKALEPELINHLCDKHIQTLQSITTMDPRSPFFHQDKCKETCIENVVCSVILASLHFFEEVSPKSSSAGTEIKPHEANRSMIVSDDVVSNYYSKSMNGLDRKGNNISPPPPSSHASTLTLQKTNVNETVTKSEGELHNLLSTDGGHPTLSQKEIITSDEADVEDSVLETASLILPKEQQQELTDIESKAENIRRVASNASPPTSSQWNSQTGDTNQKNIKQESISLYISTSPKTVGSSSLEKLTNPNSDIPRPPLPVHSEQDTGGNASEKLVPAKSKDENDMLGETSGMDDYKEVEGKIDDEMTPGLNAKEEVTNLNSDFLRPISKEIPPEPTIARKPDTHYYSSVTDHGDPYITEIADESGYFNYFLTIMGVVFIGFILFHNKKWVCCISI